MWIIRCCIWSTGDVAEDDDAKGVCVVALDCACKSSWPPPLTAASVEEETGVCAVLVAAVVGVGSCSRGGGLESGRRIASGCCSCSGDELNCSASRCRSCIGGGKKLAAGPTMWQDVTDIGEDAVPPPPDVEPSEFRLRRAARRKLDSCLCE